MPAVKSSIPVECDTIRAEMLPLVHLEQSSIEAIVDTVSGGAPNVQDVYPLTATQEALLFDHSADFDPYVNVVLLRFGSEEQREAWLTALHRAVSRHDILRTSIVSRASPQPVQVVWRRADLVVDRMGTGEGVTEDDLLARGYALRRGFDLTRAPLVRVIVGPGGDEWRIAFVSHHALLDQRSLSLLFDEVNAEASGAPAPPPTAQFRSMVAFLEDLTVESAEPFWRERLRGMHEPTTPFGIASKGAGTLTTARHQPRPFSRTLDKELNESISGFCRAVGTSRPALFHAAFALALARSSATRDVMFGTLVHGRPTSVPGMERALGMFAKAIPFRLGLSGKTGRQLVEETGTLLAQSMTHQHVPLHVIHQWSEIPPNTPLFSSLFNYVRFRGETPSDRLIAGRAHALRTAVLDRARGEECALVVAAVAESAAARFLDYLENSIRVLVTEPARVLDGCSVMPEAERRRLLVEWNETHRDYPGPKCLHELFEEQARRTPDSVALYFEGESVTYAHLDRRAARLSALLRERGVGPDALVGVCLHRSLRLVDALIGVLKAGAGFVPLDPEYPRDRLGYLVRDSAARVVVTVRDLAALFEGTGVQLLCVDEPSVQDSVDLPESAGTKGAPLHSATAAYMIYTSGSTGNPKGCVISHEAICNRLRWMQEQFNLTGSDRVLQAISTSFDPSVLQLFWPLAVGAGVVLAKPGAQREPAYLAKLIADNGVTMADFVPTVLQAFIGDDRVSACTRLLRVFSGGEVLRQDLVSSFSSRLGASLYNVYGPTEAAVLATSWHCDPSDGSNTAPIGRPLANTSLYLLDDDFEPVPIGVQGRLFIGGVSLARGYWRRADLTAERFLPDPFSAARGARMYDTGDVARYRQDGALEYVGRADNQLKIRGMRVEIGEIESALCQQPEVQDAGVAFRTDGNGEGRLVAFVSPPPVAVDLLRESLRKWLPEHMVPSAFVGLDHLPRLPNGKLDRAALLALDAPTPLRGLRAPPRTSLERELARAWIEILGVPSVGVHDNFFDLGGHSLLVVRVVERLKSQLRVDVTVPMFFANPTIATLAAAVRYGRAVQGEDPILVPFREGRGPVIVCISPIGGEVYCYRELVGSLRAAGPVIGLRARRVTDGRPLPETVEAMSADFVEALGAANPGPYLLVGWSFGGVVALELARQLVLAKRPVHAVVAIDAYLSPPGATTVGEAELLIRFLSDHLAMNGKSPHPFLGRTIEGLWSEAVHSGCIAAAEVDSLREIFSVYARNTVAYHRFEPTPAPVPVHWVRGMQSRMDGVDVAQARRRWVAVTLGRYAESAVEAHHYSIIRSPAVTAVANIVDKEWTGDRQPELGSS
jgi:amino acid adenylation domain-containing protein